MIFDILERKLIENGYQEGVSLFRGYMPGDCSVGVMTRGPLQGIPVDPYIPNYYKGEIQVITRHSDPVLGERMASSIQKILTVNSRESYPETEDRGEVNLDLFIPQTLPIQFPQLKGNGFEWSQHFQCVFSMLPVRQAWL